MQAVRNEENTFGCDDSAILEVMNSTDISISATVLFLTDYLHCLKDMRQWLVRVEFESAEGLSTQVNKSKCIIRKYDTTTTALEEAQSEV